MESVCWGCVDVGIDVMWGVGVIVWGYFVGVWYFGVCVDEVCEEYLCVWKRVGGRGFVSCRSVVWEVG